MKIYNGDTLVLDVAVDDDSYRYRAIMGKNTLVLNFSIPKHVEIPTGSHCEFQGETYTLAKPENLKMVHTRNFEYTVEMHSSQASLSKYKLRNIVDRRLKFSMTATPREHLQMLVDNLNARESGWTAGECIESAEKLISYNHTYLLDALDQMADTFNTEWEISGKTIHLHKVEYNRDNPLSLAYGKGNGFKPGVGRTNYEDSVPTEILYVQGGDRNIDASQYGSLELLLPKSKTIRFDGVHFEDEESFNADNARIYVTDADGYSIRRKDKEQMTKAEDSLDCSEIYPHRDEKVLKVIAVDTEKNWYDVVTDAPESLDYSKYGIGGETPTIVFQDGMLAGREFDLETDDDGNILCEKYYEDGVFFGWKFQIVPATLDGVKMPGGVYVPAVDDVFRIFGIRLPEAYIEEDATKSGASWEMFREGVKHLYDNEDAKFTFTGTLDGIWAKKDWLNIGGKIRLGGFISFTDSQFQPDPVLIRITGIKDYVNNPYSPEIELSNSTKGISVSSELNKITSNEEKTDNLFRNSLNFTKRRFRDARETIAMLEKAMLAGFTDSISPLTVQTMMMLVGDQSLQFRFVDSKTNPQQVSHNVEYDHDSKILTIDGGIIQHMTLGINSVSTGHNAEEYIFWTLPEFSSPVLTEADKKYYVYAKVSTIDGTGTFYMSETAKGMNSESGYYYLLMGLLNSEFDGDRSYVSMYGFTEILPGQITTDIIRDTGGNLIIDLANRLISAKNGARIDGNITIGPSSSGLENLSEWPDKQQQISTAQDSANNAQATANSALQTAQDAKDYIDNTLPDEIADMNARIDGVVENWFYDYTPTRSNEPAMTWIANGEEKKHVGDTFTNTQDYVDDATTPDAGKSWRWVASGSSYTWTPIADSDAVKALQQAAKAQDTADQKRRVFVTTPYTPYDVGDMWTAGPTGDIMRCIKARATGNYTASDWDKASKYTDDTKANEALDAIESLKVGGRNLLLGSNPMITGTGYPTDTFQLTENISDGTECSISIKGQLGTGKTRWGIYNSGGSVNMTVLTEADKDDNGIYRKTFTWRISSAANTYVSIYPMPQMSGNEPESSIEWVMLEYGNIPGSWSLAPEDIKQTFDSITNFTDEAFADGVIDRAEAAAIEKYINNIKEIQKSAEGTYTTLYNNADLTGTPKTELSSIYGGLVSVTNSLVTLINNVTADKIITDQDKSAVDESYDRVNAFLQDFNTAVENATKAIQARMKMKSDILASASMGNMLYTDPEFSKGMNSVGKYANSGSELVTLTRKEVSGVPNTSGYGIEIVSQEGTIQPGRGGFTFSTQTHANCMMVCRFIAKIPEGRTVEFASNNTGDDPTRIWLTDNAGTGQWAEYAYYVRAGATGVLSTTFYFYISGTDEVTWYLAYATVFELASDNKRISDLEYLKDTFGYVVDVNGVVLGRLVAVKDDNGNVQAMLNGSDLGKDTFNGYGKLLFASGMSGLQNPQTAETRIYEDGTIITKRLIAEEGGKIGDFQIASSGSGFGLTGSAQNAGTLYEYDRNSLFLPIGFYLHGTAKSEENVMNGMDRSAKIIGVPFGGLNSGDGEGMFPPVGQNSAFAVSSIEKKDTALAPVNIGIYVKASGHRDPSRNVAFKVPEGIFEGLRPSIKFSNSATVELAEFDHTVITHRSSSQTFLLPSSPKEGQHYEIIKGMDSRITINGNGKGIWTIGSGGIQESPYINNGRFRIFLDYTEDIGDVSDDGGWIMTWFAM